LPITTTIEYEFNSDCITTPLLSIGYPQNVSVVPFGATGTANYSYRVSAYNSSGETLASSAVQISNGLSSLSNINYNRIQWDNVVGAIGFKIYGRTFGSEQLLSSVTTNYWDDTGSISPNGSIPTKDTTGYDYTKLNLGKFQRVYSSNTNNQDNYLATVPTYTYIFSQDLAKYYNLGVAPFYGKPIYFSERYDYYVVFRWYTGTYKFFMLFQFDKLNWTMTFKGQIQVYNIVNDAEGYDMQCQLLREKRGTVNINGHQITGINTKFYDSKISEGSRIGFGTTDPSRVTTWYTINKIDNNNQLFIDSPAPSGTNIPYVIEELRIYYLSFQTFNIVKGLNFDCFSTSLSIPQIYISDTDRKRACYNIRDAVTPTINQIGFDLGPVVDDNTQYLYYMSSRTNINGDMRIFVFNIRADLKFIANGTSINPYLFKTGYQFSPWLVNRTGHVKIAKTKFDNPDNVYHLYYEGQISHYRIRLDDIKPETTNMIDASNRGTYTAQAITPFWGDINAANSRTIMYDDYTDYFIVMNNSVEKNFVYQYSSVGYPKTGVQRFFGNNTILRFRNPPEGTVYTVMTQHPFYGDAIDGLLYINMMSTSFDSWERGASSIQVFPVGADFETIKTEENRVICPAVNVSKFSKLSKILFNYNKKLGDDDYGVPPETFRVFVRDHGIEDNTGIWTQLDQSYNISFLQPKRHIQISFTFKTLGATGHSARIHSYTIIGDELENLSKLFKWNINNSNANSGIFAFDQVKLNNTSFNIKINIYKKDNNESILEQSSLSSDNGTFQYFSGNQWLSGIGPNTIGTMRRFVPSISILSDSPYFAIIEMV
jgi:hypothetical protein